MDDRPAPHPPHDEAGAGSSSEARWPAAILIAILVLLVVYTLYFARDVLVPIVIAVLLKQLLSPLVVRMKRLRIPEPLAAAGIMLTLVAGLIAGGYAISGPAAEWIARAPQGMAEIERKLTALRGSVEEVQKATERVEELAKAAAPAGDTLTVTVRETTLGEYFVINTTFLVTQIVIVFVLLFFLLASGDLFMRRFVKAFSSGQEKRRAVEIVRGVQQDVATYLGTVTLINAGLGMAVAVVMWAVGMPNPVLWGALAALMNFIPYVGALAMVVILAIAALLSFDDVAHALLVPGLFFLLTNIEANLVTPSVLGRRLTLNPAIVFVSLVTWSWLWGVAGAILAVPILVAIKAVAENVEALSGISVFLGRRDA